MNDAVSACLERNPYIGPRPFQQGELFFGREREATDLAHVLTASRIVLLHSPSGAGKTSLLQAAVVPAFAERGFQICTQHRPRFSLLRVNEPEPDFPVANRYVYSIVLGLIGHTVAEPIQLQDTSLEEALTVLQREEPSRRRQLLVFDQLEEVLSLDPTDREGQGEFFRQVGEALDHDRRWALFAIREDRMGGLDRFLKLVPGHFRSTYRLDFLDHDSAMRAILQPAEACGVQFEPAAATQLLEDLSTVRVESPKRAPALVRGPYVEPVFLQVVCHRLWRNLCRHHGGCFNRVGRADLDGFDQVAKALRRYYADAVREAAGDDVHSERRIREWFETGLITEEGYRRLSQSGPPVDDGAAVLRTLQDRYVIRADDRGGTQWWELAHDMLVDPVIRDNSEWMQRTLEPWQLEARRWHEEGEDESGLLGGDTYRQARRSLVQLGSKATEVERRFVERSAHRRAQDRTLHSLARLNNRLVWSLAASVGGNVVLVVILLIGVARARRTAHFQRRRR